MRVAITTDGNSVYPHFGHSPFFTIVEIEGREVKSQRTIENPGNRPGYLPQFLKEKGIDLVITGGMGQKAIAMFDKSGVEVFVGVNGSIGEVVYELIEGTLEGGTSACSHDHDHGHLDIGGGCDHSRNHGCGE